MKNLLLISIIILIMLTGCTTWTPADKALLTASWLAAGADYYTTKDMLKNPDNYERNPFMGEHPDDTTLITYMLSSQIIATIAAHFLPKYRKAILGVKTVVNTGCAINNSRLD